MLRPDRSRRGPDALLWPSVGLFFVAAALMAMGVRTGDDRFVMAAAVVAAAVLATRLAVRRGHARTHPPPEDADGGEDDAG